MMRYVFALLFVFAAAYAQDHTTTMHPDTREMVDIGGQSYFFGNDVVGTTWGGADLICMNLSLTVAGFESNREWNAVLNWMNANGKRDYYWTTGHNVVSDNFEWGNSGATFTANDSRWATNEPMDGNPDLPNEHVSLHVQNGQLASDPDSYTNKVICEFAV